MIGTTFRRVHAVLLLVFLVVPVSVEAFAQGAFSQGYPQPGGWVNDFAGVLDQQNRQRLLNLSVELDRRKICQLTVVTMTSIGGQSIEAYAKGLFNYWGVGRAGFNDGVMILFAMRERKLRIQVGDGLRGPLPDALCKRIMDDTIVPFMKAGRYGDGAYAGAARMAGVLVKHYGATLEIPRPARLSIGERIRSRLPGTSRRPCPPDGGLGLRWVLRLLLLPLLLPILVVYFVLRLLFGGIWWGDSDSGGGWTSGWGGGGGFGGGFSSGGGASGSW